MPYKRGLPKPVSYKSLPSKLIRMVLRNTTYREAFMFGRYLTAKEKRKFATIKNLIHAYCSGWGDYIQVLLGGITINDNILHKLSRLRIVIPIESFRIFKYKFRTKHWIHILRHKKQTRQIITEFIEDDMIKLDRYIWILLIKYQCIPERIIRKKNIHTRWCVNL
jgi:hypothetical protein